MAHHFLIQVRALAAVIGGAYQLTVSGVRNGGQSEGSGRHAIVGREGAPVVEEGVTAAQEACLVPTLSLTVIHIFSEDKEIDCRYSFVFLPVVCTVSGGIDAGTLHVRPRAIQVRFPICLRL